MDIHGTIFYQQQTRGSIIGGWHLFYSRYRLFYQVVCIGLQKQ